MRIVSINLNKRLGNPAVSRFIAEWLKGNNCDVLVAQEPWARTRKENIELVGYDFITGNSSTALWVTSHYANPKFYQHNQEWQEVELDYLSLHNVYLSAYQSADRIKQLEELRGRIENSDDRPVLVVGDFNLAPCSNDGIVGDETSRWTNDKERKFFDTFLKEGKLIDSTSFERSGVQEFTIERTRQEKQIKFRCDLALVSDYVAPLLNIKYDHSSRVGAGAFTDHSSLIIDAPVNLPEQSLFPSLFPSEIRGLEFHPHKTAMSRGENPSKIGNVLQSSGLLERLKIKSILDYGCGRGADVKFYRSLGFNADGFDPHIAFGWETLPSNIYDLVTVVFVLNVLPNPLERLNVVKLALQKVRKGGWLLIAARSPKEIQREATNKNWASYNDGFLSHAGRGTFQKGISNEEIHLYLKRAGATPESESLPFGNNCSAVLCQKP